MTTRVWVAKLKNPYFKVFCELTCPIIVIDYICATWEGKIKLSNSRCWDLSSRIVLFLSPTHLLLNSSHGWRLSAPSSPVGAGDFTNTPVYCVFSHTEADLYYVSAGVWCSNMNVTLLVWLTFCHVGASAFTWWSESSVKLVFRHLTREGINFPRSL